jgi:hypothetical protein
MNFKPIETRYKGYRFRSRLEARWAVFFDAVGLAWEYEKEGFELSDGTRYLPDFFMPAWNMWFEVKPTAPSATEITKARLLSAGHWDKGKPFRCVQIICGQPGVAQVRHEGNQWAWNNGNVILSVGPDENVPVCIAAFAMTGGGSRLDVWPIYLADPFETSKNIFSNPVWPNGIAQRLYLGDGVVYDHPDLIKAYESARSARFEFGESGGSRA